MRAAGLSDIGQIREINEDAFWFDADRGIFVIADGLGGHKAGEVASVMAVETISSRMSDAIGSNLEDEYLIDTLQGAFSEASNLIYNTARGSKDLEGMACSIVVALLRNNYCLVAHVGDTRLYLYYQGKLNQMTMDDTPVAALVKRGYVLPENSRNHTWANILLKTVGGKSDVEATISKFPVRQDDRLLFCTDGLYNMLEESLILEILDTEKDPEVACASLIRGAQKGGAKDNVTVIVADIEEIPQPLHIVTARRLPPLAT